MLQQPSSLTIPKIRNILKLQQLFHNKFLTVELVHQLISLYTCCVEVIDQKQEQLRTYFLEKIQFVLSRAQVQALLNTVINVQEKFVVENLRDTLRITERNQMTVHAKTQALTPNFEKKRLYNYNGDNPNQKKKKIDIQLKLMNEMQNNMKNLSSQVQAADLKYKQQHKMIKNIAQEQNSKLQERLARRKNKKRKQSVDQQKQEDLLLIGKFDKNQMIRAQKEINQAVIRITMRATQRQNMMEKNEEMGREVKGRVKTIKRQELDQ